LKERNLMLNQGSVGEWKSKDTQRVRTIYSVAHCIQEDGGLGAVPMLRMLEQRILNKPGNWERLRF
jgi:hypothetical protein